MKKSHKQLAHDLELIKQDGQLVFEAAKENVISYSKKHPLKTIAISLLLGVVAAQILQSRK